MTAKADAPHIGLVVEGAGDKLALPMLLRAHLERSCEFRDVLGKPVPLNGRDKAFPANGIEGYVAVAGLRPGCVGVLVVLDGEGSCVAEQGTLLQQRGASQVAVPVLVALADADYEDWLYASSETLELGLTYRPAAGGQRQIKEALRPQAYTKPVWQPKLTARMDLELAASRSASLERMLARFDNLRQLLPDA